MGASGKIWLAGSSLLALAVGMARHDAARADTTISAATAAQQNWAAGNFTITNTGTISNPAIGINATGTNSGTLTVAGGGKINASTNGVTITNTATIGTISNSGTIISTGGTGIIDSGTITVLSNSGTITGAHPGISISGGGTILTLSNTGTIHGGNTDIANSGRIGTLTNSGVLLKGLSNLPGGSITSLINSGTISASSGSALLNQQATIGTLTNSGTITFSGGNGLGNISVGNIGLINNTGLITAGHTAVQNQATIGTLANSGTISGATAGLTNTGSIGTVTNSGTISGSATHGLFNNTGGTIGTVTNSGTISARYALWNRGTISVVNNAIGGTISGRTTGLYSTGTIFTITNSGTITGGNGLMSAAGTIGTLINSGAITGTTEGLFIDNSSLGTVTNSGVISGGTGLRNLLGTIGTVTNSGTIAGQTNAINLNSGSIGAITNSGVIAGSIVNSTANTLTIAGGTGSTFGVLTGYNAGTPSASSPGTVGSISNTSANLVFSGGNLLLNDNINVGAGHTVSSGATLKIQNAITITGQLSQSGGGLVVVAASATSYGYMTVSGNATVANATITISGSGLAAGESFSIVRSGGTGSYTGDTATISGTSGLGATVTTSGNNLLVTLAAAAQYTPLGNSAGGAATGMGTALDAIAASTNPTAVAFQNTVLASLNALPSSSQPGAVKQLAPSQLSPQVQVTQQTSAPTQTAIEQHELTMLEGGGVGAAAGSGWHQYGFWGQVVGGVAQRDSDAAADGYRAHDVGLVLGLDDQVNPDLVVGAALSWLNGRSSGLDASAGSSVTTDTYQLTFYGTQRWGQAFVDGQAGVGYTNFGQTRAISFLGAAAQAHYDGELYLVKLGGGYDVPVAGVTLTPLMGLRFLHEDSSAYSETGAGNADLSVNSRGVQSLTQDLGGQIAWSTETGWGVLKPQARVAWVHDYTHGPIASSGLIGGQAFTSFVARPSADGVRINLAATLERSDELSLRAEYEGEVRHDYQSHTGLLKATWGF